MQPASAAGLMLPAAKSPSAAQLPALLLVAMIVRMTSVREREALLLDIPSCSLIPSAVGVILIR